MPPKKKALKKLLNNQAKFHSACCRIPRNISNLMYFLWRVEEVGESQLILSGTLSRSMSSHDFIACCFPQVEKHLPELVFYGKDKCLFVEHPRFSFSVINAATSHCCLKRMEVLLASWMDVCFLQLCLRWCEEGRGTESQLKQPFFFSLMSYLN